MNTYQFDTSKLNLHSVSDKPAILVACGSFNPITTAHLQLFEIVRDTLEKQHGFTILGGFVSPVHDGYGKAGLISMKHRVEMCRRAVMDSDWIVVDNWEVSQPSYTKTLYVLQHFQREINNATGKNVQVFFLCGADLLQTFVVPNVWNPEDVECILRDFGITAVERDGFSINDFVFNNDLLYRFRKNIFAISKIVKYDLSSTQVRQLRKRGYSIRYYVPDSVLRYIEENNLYPVEQW